jgi:hypothetical protein
MWQPEATPIAAVAARWLHGSTSPRGHSYVGPEPAPDALLQVSPGSPLPCTPPGLAMPQHRHRTTIRLRRWSAPLVGFADSSESWSAKRRFGTAEAVEVERIVGLFERERWVMHKTTLAFKPYH